MIATLFLSVGGIYSRYEASIDKFFKGKNFVILILPDFVSICITLCSNNIVECTIKGGNINSIGLATICVETYAIIKLCKMVNSVGIVNWIGCHSLGMYFFCGEIPNIIGLLFLRFSLPINFSAVIVAGLISIIIAMFLCWFVYKLAPYVFGFSIVFRKINNI